MQRILVAAVAVMASAAFADEATFVFKSVEDPAHPPDPAVCAAAGFPSNVRLGASLYAVKTRAKDGKVQSDDQKKIGTATACLLLTNPFFPAGLTDNFYVQFDLPQGTYTATGTCTVSTNNVPLPFIILAGCTLKLTSGPAGSQGGMVTSNSIFNPLKRPGFSTGSLWTIQEYLTAPAKSDEHDDDDGH
jgi:hypothetical protein